MSEPEMSPFIRQCESELPAVASTGESDRASSSEAGAPPTESVDLEEIHDREYGSFGGTASVVASTEDAPNSGEQADASGPTAEASETSKESAEPQAFQRTEVTIHTASETIQKDMADGTFVLCVKCKYPVTDTFRARIWGKKKGEGSATFCCRTCNNVMSLVSKKLDSEEMALMDLDINSLPSSEAESFFQQVTKCLDADGNLSWAAIKKLLLEMFTNQKMKSVDTVSFSEEELPLSVWKTRGFDVTEIMQGGKKSPHPVFKEVWSVPLKTTKHDEVTFSVC